MNPFFVTDFSISDSLKTVRKSVLIYETIIIILAGAFSNVTTVDAKTKNGFTYDKKEFDVKWSKYEQIEKLKNEKNLQIDDEAYYNGLIN